MREAEAGFAAPTAPKPGIRGLALAHETPYSDAQVMRSEAESLSRGPLRSGYPRIVLVLGLCGLLVALERAVVDKART